MPRKKAQKNITNVAGGASASSAFRCRNWCVITYESPLVVIPNLLAQSTHYAFIAHDHDDGKKLHYHCVLCFNDAKTLKTLQNKKNFFGQGTLFGEPIRFLRQAVRYLIHKDCPEKYQYKLSDIVGDSSWFNEYFSVKYTVKDIVTDLVGGARLFDMVNKYGALFVLHYNTYRKLVNDILLQEHRLTSFELAKDMNDDDMVADIFHFDISKKN